MLNINVKTNTKESQALEEALNKIREKNIQFYGTYYQIRDDVYYINEEITDALLDVLTSSNDAQRRVKDKIKEVV